ncbi:hypothetical protein ACJD0Z_11500 [Flavobacteriaceae bacterium M23B6Z8]
MKNIRSTYKFGKVLSILLIAFVVACNSDDDINREATDDETVRVESFIDGSETFQYTYDEERRLSGYERSNSSSSRTIDISYDEEGRIATNGSLTYIYNERGQVVEITSDAADLFFRVSYELDYNILGQLIEVKQFSNAGSLRRSVEYVYNEESQIIQENGFNSGTFPNYSRNIYTYDTNGNRALIKYQASNDGVSYYQEGQDFLIFSDNENPFYSMQKSLQGSNEVPITDLFTDRVIEYQFQNRNTISSRERTSIFDSGNRSETFNYVYDEDGLPTAQEAIRINNTGEETIINSFWTYIKN